MPYKNKQSIGHYTMNYQVRKKVIPNDPGKNAMDHNIISLFSILQAKATNMKGEHYIGASSLRQIQSVHPTKRGNPNNIFNTRRQIFLTGNKETKGGSKQKKSKKDFGEKTIEDTRDQEYLSGALMEMWTSLSESKREATKSISSSRGTRVNQWIAIPPIRLQTILVIDKKNAISYLLT